MIKHVLIEKSGYLCLTFTIFPVSHMRIPITFCLFRESGSFKSHSAKCLVAHACENIVILWQNTVNCKVCHQTSVKVFVFFLSLFHVPLKEWSCRLHRSLLPETWWDRWWPSLLPSSAPVFLLLFLRIPLLPFLKLPSLPLPLCVSQPWAYYSNPLKGATQ